MTTDQSMQDLLAAGDTAIAAAAFQTGDFTAARAAFGQAHDLAGDGGDPVSLARARNGLGMVAHHENLTGLIGGTPPAGLAVEAEEQLFRSALSAAEEAGEAAVTAQSLFGLGLVFQVLRQDWMTAMPFYWQALGLVTAPDNEAGLYLRSEVHRHVGFYFAYEDVQRAQALRHLQISLELREDLGDPRYLPSALVALGEVETAAGNAARAVELLARAVEVARAEKLLPHRVEDAERALREAETARDGTSDG